MTREPDDGEPSRRPPDYVIVVSDWLNDRNPTATSLHQALHAGQDRHRDPKPKPEPDLEAEP